MLTAQPKLDRTKMQAESIRRPVRSRRQSCSDQHGLSEIQIALVSGDNLLRLAELKSAGCDFKNLETGEPCQELRSPVVSANAYLGAPPITEA